MHRAISNYKITKRKDGRYYVPLQNGGDITPISKITNFMVQQHINDLSRLGGKIHEKLTLTVKEAAAYSNIGMNLIDKLLRAPNCPFVLFVAQRNRSSARSLTSSSVTHCS